MGFLKPGRGSAGGLPWHEPRSRPSSLRQPWIPEEEDKNNPTLRGSICGSNPGMRRQPGPTSESSCPTPPSPKDLGSALWTAQVTSSWESEAVGGGGRGALGFLLCKEGGW